MRKHFAAVALATLALAVTASPSAAATVIPPSKTIDSGPALIHGRQVTDPDQAQALVTAYWTPERMRAAVPADEPLPGDPALERIDRPGNVGEPRDGARPAAPTLTLSGAPVSTMALNLTKGVGRVFFTNAKGEDKSCSGSTINNPSGNMVSTAGHCVHGGKKSDWHDNWIYVPGYHNGSWSEGIWSAYWYTSPDGWTKKSYDWWDFAFVNVHKLNGKKLVQVAGGNGISYNYSKWSSTVLMGYPADPPYDGSDQYHCQGSMYPHLFAQVGFNCFLTGGASGGPFFRGYDNNLRLGFTSSVISHGPDDKNYGPYFDNDVHDFYSAAKNK
jgi:V8-like Glu-specific endopeptidase